MKGTLKILYALLAIAIFFVAIGIIIYTVYSYGGEPKTSDFGHFGSFIGGISSTLLGATTSLFLLYQLSKMDESFKEQERSRKISETFNRLDYYDRSTTDTLKVVFAQMKVNGQEVNLTFAGLVGEDTFNDEFSDTLIQPTQYHLNVFRRLASRYAIYGIAASECCLFLDKEGYSLEAGVRFSRFYEISKNLQEKADEWELNVDYGFDHIQSVKERLTL